MKILKFAAYTVITFSCFLISLTSFSQVTSGCMSLKGTHWTGDVPFNGQSVKNSTLSITDAKQSSTGKFTLSGTVNIGGQNQITMSSASTCSEQSGTIIGIAIMLPQANYIVSQVNSPNPTQLQLQGVANKTGTVKK